MKRKHGRPQKYSFVLTALNDLALYSPSLIAEAAEIFGLLDPEIDPKLARRRIRITMGRFANSHGFPDEGDGLLHIKGQAPTPAWFGWRWKQKSGWTLQERKPSICPTCRRPLHGLRLNHSSIRYKDELSHDL